VKTTEQNYLRWMDPNAKDGYEARADAGVVPGAEFPRNRHKTGTSAPVSDIAFVEGASEAFETAG
jgi:hypothetical protein